MIRSDTPRGRALWAALPAFCLPVAAVALLTAHTSHGSAGSGAPPSRRASDLLTVSDVQAAPLYRTAVDDYRHKRYADALQLVERMRRHPALSIDAAAFCERQVRICAKAAGIKTAAVQALGQSVVQAAGLTAAQARRNASGGPNLADCGPRALSLACDALGMDASPARLSALAGTAAKGTTMAGLAAAAKAVGLKAEGVQVSREGFEEVEPPAVAWCNRSHFVCWLGRRGSGAGATVIVHDPNEPEPRQVPQEELLRMSGGYMLLVTR